MNPRYDQVNELRERLNRASRTPPNTFRCPSCMQGRSLAGCKYVNKVRVCAKCAAEPKK